MSTGRRGEVSLAASTPLSCSARWCGLAGSRGISHPQRGFCGALAPQAWGCTSATGSSQRSTSAAELDVGGIR